MESSSEQLEISRKDLKAILSKARLTDDEERVANSMIGHKEDPKVWTENTKPVREYNEKEITVPKNQEIREFLSLCRHEQVQYPEADAESMSDRSTTSDEESLLKDMAENVGNDGDGKLN